MTREEAIEKLELLRQKVDEDTYRALIMAIKALEQEPCDDAISREEAIKVIRQTTSRYTLAKEKCGMGQVEWSDHLIKESDAIDGLNELPSVTPSRGWEEMTVPCKNCGHDMTFKIAVCGEPSRKGHWIEEDMYDGDICYRCSECNEVFCLIEGTPELNEYHFCPDCGAEMESEE